MALSVPTIHMNGTSQQELLDQICMALSAIRDAEQAMRAVTPNGRDYYPQGPDAIQEALRQHANRLHNLRAVHDELEQIGETIASHPRR
jgi:polysaccharide pyruvyl transferase WcaK-like protein